MPLKKAIRVGRIAVHFVGGIFLLCSASVSSLAAADWQAGKDHRWRELKVPATGRTFLQRLAPSVTGINFTNFISEERGLENSLRTSGAGVAAGDVDGDGWCDLYLCGTENADALYRNSGDWKFEEITKQAGLDFGRGRYSSGAVLADVDGDNDLDLLLNSLGEGTRLFLNDGKGHFSAPADSGLVRKYGSTSMALADIDGNGTLDLYVANYATTKIEDRPNARFDAKMVDGRMVLSAIDGVPMTSPELTNRYYVDSERVVRERGEPDILYLNNGQGKFTRVSWTEGAFLDEAGKPVTQPPLDFGLSVMFRDMDGDGAPDIYICNDLFPPDRIWMNDGRGRFRALSNFAVRNTSRFSMGVDFADINRDGYDDFFVVDMLSRDHVNRKMQVIGVPPQFLPIGKVDDRPQYKRNTLFLNRGDGTYAEIAQLSGLEATEWSWMPAFLDLDLDGFEDVLVTTGHFLDSLNADAVTEILKRRSGKKLSDLEHRALKRQFYPILKTMNQAFRNKGDLTFEDKTKEWGFDYVGISQALALADLDNDGDLDLVVVHLNDVVGIYRNETAAPRIAVRLKGEAPNTHGIGAKIRFVGGPMPQAQEMICGGRYLSTDDTMRMFAAGQRPGGMRIEVTWRDGSTSVVNDVQPNRLYEISEAGATAKAVSPQGPPPVSASLFADESGLINHTHVDEGFNDFEQQPVLGRRLSQLGPGITWHDVNGDSWDDLIIGSGVGGRMAVYENNRKGGFQLFKSPAVDKPLKRDQTTILALPDRARPSSSFSIILAGSSNYEDGAPQGGCALEFDLSKHVIEDNLPPWECGTGPLAMADWDGDGKLDLFVGGRVLPGKYPEEPFSLLLRGGSAKFELDEDGVRQITHAGMVSGAVFSDLNGDGSPELILACEWGPLRVFQYQPADARAPRAQRKWRELTSELGLAQYTGWWNGVATGDFDNDGRMDIVASNWGRNTKYQSYRQQPQRVYYGDWRGNGAIDALEAYYDPALNKVVPWCSVQVARTMPWVAERFANYESVGRASVAELLGERMKSAKVLEATWLDTTVFLNRSNRFEVSPLPVEAQFSPAFGISIGDMDGDGNEDIFLSQNLFATDGDTPRSDAGRGLLLAGNGKGNFRAVPGQESGVTVYGEQRGCALSDYDADGRVDLAVTQNGAATKLYRNIGAKPGLRVRLNGPRENPEAIGAVMQLVSGEGARVAGPAREVHAGSGYWSQDSAVQVLAVSNQSTNTQLRVRWPGGRVTVAAIPAGAKEISVESSGTIKQLR